MAGDSAPFSCSAFLAASWRSCSQIRSAGARNDAVRGLSASWDCAAEHSLRQGLAEDPETESRDPESLCRYGMGPSPPAGLHSRAQSHPPGYPTHRPGHPALACSPRDLWRASSIRRERRGAWSRAAPMELVTSASRGAQRGARGPFRPSLDRPPLTFANSSTGQSIAACSALARDVP